MENERKLPSSAQNPSLLRSLRYMFLGSLGVWLFSQVGALVENHDRAVSLKDALGPEGRQREVRASIVSRIAPAPTQEPYSDGRKDNAPLWEKTAAITIAAGTLGLLAVNMLLWWDTHNNFITDERAWLGLDKPMIAERINYPGPRFTWSGPDGVKHLVENPNPLIHTGVSIKNFGKTPAFDVIVSVFSSTSEQVDVQSRVQCQFAEDFSTGKAIRDSKRTDLKWPTMGNTLFPGDELFQPADVPGGDIPRIDIIGCVAYRDAFNKRHKTRFCFRSPQVFVSDPDMKDGDPFIQCKAYNDAN